MVISSRDSDAGSGLIPTVTGVTIFLLLLLVAVQVAFNLYVASAVQAAAFDAARLVAADGSDLTRAQALADSHVRSVLGRYGDEQVTVVTLELEGEDITLTVSARNRSLLPRLLPDGLASDRIERSARVRIERRQDIAQ